MLEESNETIFQMKDAMYFSFKELQLNMDYIFCIAIRSNITLHDPYQGHCNGTKYIITNLHTRIIEAVVANGPYAGNNILIPRIPLIPSETSFPFRMKRKQFPIRPCFAITSNKSQGQKFFSHGDYYVAQSRVGSAANLRVLCPESPATTKNVVYPDS